MSYSYTKLFSSITESTIWVEPYPTRIVWVSMLAMADRMGRIWASVPGLARRSGVTLEECEAALERFLGPDKYSRTPDNDGRRIEVIPGGWRLLNYEKYRSMRDEEARREYQREWDRTKRVRGPTNPTNPTNPTKSDRDRPQPTQAEAEAEAEAVKADTTTTAPSAPSARRASRLPTNWNLTSEQIEWALGAQPSWTPEHVLRVGEKFRDYWTAKAGRDATKVDWEATWRNWVRNEPEGRAKPKTADPFAGAV